nr:MoaD/ThiS family protein [Candidatus Sigynarchaeota archaeon]
MATTVKVQFLSNLCKYVGGSRAVTVSIEGPATVAGLLSRLKEMFGTQFTEHFLNPNGTFHDSIVFLVNGLNLKQYEPKYPDPMLVELNPSDDIVFVVNFGGG